MLSKEALVIGATCRALLIGLNPIDSWLRHRLQGMAHRETREDLKAKQVFPLSLPQLVMGKG